MADDPDPSPIGAGMPSAQNHAGRILRPAVRRGWLDGEGGAARGQDAFVEVGWDEALDLAAGELARVKQEHGNASIYGGSYGWGSAGRFHHPNGLLRRFLNFHGGCTASVNSYSCAAMEVILPHVIGGASNAIYSSAPHWDEIAEHTELIVAFGGLAMKNTQINSGGLARHVARSAQAAARDAGVDFVNISPLRADVDEHQSARWIAPRPNTDVALMLGIAHTMIGSGTHDRRFLRECCVGWDELEAYITGARDGVQRDAAWAAAICDIEPRVIEQLAAEMTARRTLVTVSWSLQRADHGEQPFWMGVALAAMTGSMGKPGGGFGSGLRRDPLGRRAARPPPHHVALAGPATPSRCAHPSHASPTCCSSRARSSTTTDSASRSPTSASSTGAAATRSTTTRTSTASCAAGGGPTP